MINQQVHIKLQKFCVGNLWNLCIRVRGMSRFDTVLRRFHGVIPLALAVILDLVIFIACADSVVSGGGTTVAQPSSSPCLSGVLDLIANW